MTSLKFDLESGLPSINVTEGWTLWWRFLVPHFPSSYLTSVVGIQKTTLWILDVYFPRLQMFLIVELCFTDMRHKWYWFINVNIKGVNFINFHVRVLLHAVLGCSRKGLLILKYSACEFTIELLLEELYEKWQGVT